MFSYDILKEFDNNCYSQTLLKIVTYIIKWWKKGNYFKIGQNQIHILKFWLECDLWACNTLQGWPDFVHCTPILYRVHDISICFLPALVENRWCSSHSPTACWTSGVHLLLVTQSTSSPFSLLSIPFSSSFFHSHWACHLYDTFFTFTCSASRTKLKLVIYISILSVSLSTYAFLYGEQIFVLKGKLVFNLLYI